MMEAVPVGESDFMNARCEWPRYYGIPEPPASFPAADISGIDLALTPSLAVDKEGFRLGHGGGYYDRFIAASCTEQNSHVNKTQTSGRPGKKKHPIFAAIQFSAFLRDEDLPREVYDMPVDVIITENGIVIPSSLSFC
jgi:5-formyltetrahydrofolate cyclo-ligase